MDIQPGYSNSIAIMKTDKIYGINSKTAIMYDNWGKYDIDMFYGGDMREKFELTLKLINKLNKIHYEYNSNINRIYKLIPPKFSPKCTVNFRISVKKVMRTYKQGSNRFSTDCVRYVMNCIKVCLKMGLVPETLLSVANNNVCKN